MSTRARRKNNAIQPTREFAGKNINIRRGEIEKKNNNERKKLEIEKGEPGWHGGK